MASRVMRAIRVSQFGGPEVLKIVTDVPVPRPQDKQVFVINMYAFVAAYQCHMRCPLANIFDFISYFEKNFNLK